MKRPPEMGGRFSMKETLLGAHIQKLVPGTA